MKAEQKITIGVLLLTLVVIGGGIWLSSNKAEEKKERLAKDMMGEKIPDLGGAHVARGETHPPYNSNPPTSGWHWSGVAGPGIKDEPIADELMLHSMEHGAAVVWYRDDLTKTEIDRIKEAFVSASGKKIMVPRKDLEVPVALTSWGYLLKLNEIDARIIKEFIETNNNRAPEDEAI